MSALPPKADIRWWSVDVRFVLIADIAPLFDHFVSTAEQRERHPSASAAFNLN
jgi:hypothetical protein